MEENNVTYLLHRLQMELALRIDEPSEACEECDNCEVKNITHMTSNSVFVTYDA